MAGLLVIISAPAGGGKDAVINTLLKRLPNSARFITTTSRAPRPGNREGVDYFFISQEEFKKRIEQKEFVEYNFMAGNYYGAPRASLEAMLKKYDVVLSQIDTNGKHGFDKQGIANLSIFLLPDSLDNLRARAEKRGGMTPENIAERMEIAKKEIAASADYDHRILNIQGKLEETIAQVEAIILQELAKRPRLDKKA